MYRVVISEAERFPELAACFYTAGPAHAVSQVSAYLRIASAKEQIHTQDPDFAAEQFFALMQTHLCMKRRFCLIGISSQADLEHVVSEAVRMFLANCGRKT